MSSKIKLSPEALEAKRAYSRKWNREHPERCREAQRRYWERKAAQIAEAKKKEGEDDEKR